LGTAVFPVGGKDRPVVVTQELAGFVEIHAAEAIGMAASRDWLAPV
jgi:hypothetical protein